MGMPLSLPAVDRVFNPTGPALSGGEARALLRDPQPAPAKRMKSPLREGTGSGLSLGECPSGCILRNRPLHL
ncbi:hypothetical protein MES4922_250018 [Mesorhizobium ventifaucium]|uniref:Propionyl-coenzyme A carboxylase alpha polypeptide n=1 Tax=Mesorhizobium ventifaucium TaxID=666020 RepID=A0ABM9DV08_9HYPH|nr:hypothetical protein MES4922_250018 [Mesorhizobium ventifaucium]